MSLNGMLVSNQLGTGVYTVTRTAAGTRENGRYTPGGVTSLTVVAGIEPASGRQLKDLPEGRRGDETVAIFSQTQLLTTSPTTEPDVITYLGEPWTIVSAKFWEGLGESHCEALAQRAPSPAGLVP